MCSNWWVDGRHFGLLERMGDTPSKPTDRYSEAPASSAETYWPADDLPLGQSNYYTNGSYGASTLGGSCYPTSSQTYSANSYRQYDNYLPLANSQDRGPGLRFMPNSYLPSPVEVYPRQTWPTRQSTPARALQDPVILWDWDDTLMCSTAINANMLYQHQAQQLDALLEQVLTLSMRLGDTSIITNADELWVYESSRRFAPRILPLLSRMVVMSARRKYERSWPNDIFAWKREAFREVLTCRRRGGLNLVVLGDSPAEMEAASSSTVGMPSTLVKTVKFKETPSADELLEQLKMVAQELGNIVLDDKSGCRSLAHGLRQPSVLTSPMQAPGIGASWASSPCGGPLPTTVMHPNGTASPLLSSGALVYTAAAH